ncbi:MAG: hypothetical protein NXI01_10435 [Gammaproteobacteria bacterium]|nr:hypothetical protein [Gammaproteobacteria bacterium]
MQNKDLVIMMVGDDKTRKLVYKSFHDTQTRKRQEDEKGAEKQFPSMFLDTDTAVNLGSGTTATHMIGNKPRTFRLVEKTLAGLASTLQDHDLENKSADLTHKALTVLLCFDPNNTSDLSDLMNSLIELKTKRKGSLFNIVPVCAHTGNASEQKQSSEAIETPLKLGSFFNEVRDTLYISFDDLNNADFTDHIAQIYDVSSNLPLYEHLNQAIETLQHLSETLRNNRDIQSLVNIISLCGSMTGNNHNKAAAQIGMHLSSHMASITNTCQNLRKTIEQSDIPNKTYWGYIFLNFIKSLSAVLLACTGFGAYFTYRFATENLRNHNSIFKFHPTNNKDECRGNVAAVEDTCAKLSVIPTP